MPDLFADHSILITGAAGGLGRALTRNFAMRGARLLLLDCNARRLERLSDRVVEDGCETPGICPLDLAQAGPDAFEELTQLLMEEYGGLDHLVHCAADFDGLRPLDQIAPEAWLRGVQVNLNAAWLLTVTCLPLLFESRSASVTFLLEGEQVGKGAYWGAYGVSKSALASLAAMFAAELEGRGIAVLGINPGPMRTALRAAAFLAEDPGLQPDPSLAAQRIVEQIAGSVVADPATKSKSG